MDTQLKTVKSEIVKQELPEEEINLSENLDGNCSGNKKMAAANLANLKEVCETLEVDQCDSGNLE